MASQFNTGPVFSKFCKQENASGVYCKLILKVVAILFIMKIVHEVHSRPKHSSSIQ